MTSNQQLDSHIVNLLAKISELREQNNLVLGRAGVGHNIGGHNSRHGAGARRTTMGSEARSLELWRAVAVECLATFLFTLVVCGATLHANGLSSGLLSPITTAIAAGFGMSAINLIFGHVSGGHANPAVSVAFAMVRKISPLRATLYVAAQCGGGIAGVAMLYGVTINPGQQNFSPSNRLAGTIEKLLVELALSIFVVLAHFAADVPRFLPAAIASRPAGVLAATYTAATLVAGSFINPARALGPAFVTHRWDHHWVFWMGPIAGGIIAALLHEYVLTPSKRPREPRDYDDGDNSSLRSDEDTYDDLHKNGGAKFPGAYATYRPVAGAASLYGVPPGGPLERVESIYGGTKSLYCKSPPLTRANLNRSQSVYTKSTNGVRDTGLIFPRSGPLVPAQSLYPIRLGANTTTTTLSANTSANTAANSILSNSCSPQNMQHQQTPNQTQTLQTHTANQNVQNQLQQCTQNIYGMRGINRDNIYGAGVYGRAPAIPPSNHGGPATPQNQSPIVPPSIQTHQQHQQQQQQNQQQQQQQHNHQPTPPPPPPPATNSCSSSDSGGPGAGQRRCERDSGVYGQMKTSTPGGPRGDDSAYGSYQSSTRGIYGKPPPPLGWGMDSGNAPLPPPHGNPQQQHNGFRDQSRPSAGPLQQNQQQSTFQRNSPNPQY